MGFILLDVKAGNEIVSNREIVILVITALIAIAAITAFFLWRKKKNKK